MSSTSSPRRRRRGGQNRRPSEGQAASQRQSSRTQGRPGQRAPSAVPKKKGLIAKIVGFFKGEPASPAPSPGRGGESSRPREDRQQPVERRTRHVGGGQSQGARSRGEAQVARAERQVKRGPDLREVTGTRLYVGNLSYDATEEDLTELFRGVGTVESAEVVTHSRTQRSKGFAFIEMSAVEQAKRAAEQLHDTDFMGRKLVVTGAKPATAQDQQGA